MYRIVHNDHTGLFRDEKRGGFGWNFVTDPHTGDYLGFTDADTARVWICDRTRVSDNAKRRWKIASDCHAWFPPPHLTQSTAATARFGATLLQQSRRLSFWPGS